MSPGEKCVSVAIRANRPGCPIGPPSPELPPSAGALQFAPMTNSASPPAIRLRGVRQNNLKNFDLDVRLGRLSVVTGLSGSGKSSLAFDTLFAEGQRRYIETFSP